MNHMKHESIKHFLKLTTDEDIRERAEILASNLWIAIHVFFAPRKIAIQSRIDHGIALQPGFGLELYAELEETNETDNRKVTNPATFLDFRSRLSSLFTYALKTRNGLEQLCDARYRFYFPSFKTPFSLEEHVNEEHTLHPTLRTTNIYGSHSRATHIPTKFKNRIFLTTMFGVAAGVRRLYDEDYEAEVRISRASVYPLD